MSKRKTTRVHTIEEHHLEVDAALLIKALRAVGYDVPDTADIWMWVPGGGDWSNTRLDVDEDGAVHVTWTENRYEPPVVEEK